MTTQLTVRMADDAVAHVDRTVAEGTFTSRAAYLSWLVRKDAMRRRAIEDIAKLQALGGEDPYPELAGLADWVNEHPLPLD